MNVVSCILIKEYVKSKQVRFAFFSFFLNVAQPSKNPIYGKNPSKTFCGTERPRLWN